MLGYVRAPMFFDMTPSGKGYYCHPTKHIPECLRWISDRAPEVFSVCYSLYCKLSSSQKGKYGDVVNKAHRE